MNNTKDVYSSWDELYEKAVPFKEYFISSKNRISPVSIIAIHGGGIEGGTTEIAETVAELGQYRFYSFLGMINEQLDCNENLRLHVTSNKFLDSKCLEIVGNSIATVSLHGADEETELTYVGGKNFIHADFIKQELRYQGFNVPDAIRKGLEGYGPLNICNRNMKNMGVQIEMSKGLRVLLFGDDWKQLAARNNNRSEYFYKYCKAIWTGTQKYLCTL